MLFIDFGVDMAPGLNGVGIRAWELAAALSAYEEVLVLTPDVPHPDVRETWSKVAWRRTSELPSVRHDQDVLLYGFATDPQSIARFKKAGAICVFDAIIWPMEYTGYQWIRDASDSSAAYQEVLDDYLRQLRLADGYLVASQMEKQVLTGMLTTCSFERLLTDGLDLSLEDIIATVPVGLSAVNERSQLRLAGGTSAPAPDFVWNGGLWNHYSPVAAVRGLGALLDGDYDASLWFLYPLRGTATAAYRAVQEAVRADPRLATRVRFCDGGLSMLERISVLESARAAVCLYEPHVLWDLCPPMRLRETLLYQLPIVTTRRGALGDLVAARGLGMTAASLAPEEVASAMRACLDGGASKAMRAAAAAAGDDFSYEGMASELGAWLDRLRAR
ncbi:glycosyltransferase family 4 protein [Kitasatospora acidiphila]|uniref:Glycosyltransferase family 4 protein n=1 Tax=Kitasatospora acidiphila TaxID=2567942 RepID=A0A540VYX8_9ACTN|nr:glycosyltransferase family 4 protein [Kitasatospora acidiphila]TQF01965.1 glycosyltransferase family 4 protein [Kitasatospora acidiphila]